MSDRESENILEDAVARNMAVVLSLPSAGMLRHCKSRFLIQTDEGIWLEGAPEQAMLVDDLIARQNRAAISFKSGTKKASFTAQVLKRDPAYRINATTVVEAVLIAKPSNVKAVQRRNDYRVTIPPESDISARMWRLAEHAHLKDRPMDAQELSIRLRDISLGGMGVTLAPRDGQTEPTRVSEDERLRIVIKRGGDELLIEGRLRHVPVGKVDPSIAFVGASGSITIKAPIRAGIQFKKLQNDLAGRQISQTLATIIGEMQREEVRRLRLGLNDTPAA